MAEKAQIPADRVALLDPNTNTVSRQWYRYFQNLQLAASGTVTSVNVTGGTTGLTTSGGPVTTSGTIVFAGTLGVANGGTGATTAATALTNLGAYPASNPAGYTSNVGTVTSISGTGTVSGLTLSGTVTSSGSLTLSGTLAVTPSNFASQTANTVLAAPNGLAGVPTFRAIVAADIPTLNQNTTGTASNVTGTVAIANGGTGATTAATALTNLGAYPASNPSGYTSNVGTVTSVGQSFTGGLISVAGSPVTTSGTLALTVAGTSGGVPYFSSGTTWASSAALAANALVIGGGAGNAPATITTGTGVTTALGVNTGTAGAFVVNGGALGTPSSGTVTNLTGTASININGTVGATTANTGAFTSVTSTSAAGILTRAAATQDGVELIGRAGGTTSLKVTLTPTTLTASRTLTAPDNSGTILTTGATVTVGQGGTGQTSYTNGQLLIGNTTGNTLTKSTLTAGTGISITNGAGAITIAATSGGGTVTSVAALTLGTTGTDLSSTVANSTTTPVITLNVPTASAANRGALSAADWTTFNNKQAAFGSQTANFFYAAPNGLAGVPTFRAIVAADIPTLNQNTTGTASNVTGTVAIANGGTGATTAATALTNLGAYPASNPSGYTSNVGTVTSVSGTGTVSGLTLSGTVTSSGSLTLGGTLAVTPSNFASQTANTVLAAPNGLAGVPTFRALVAADVPTLNQNTTGTASNVTGVVALANGGSGQTSAQTAMNAFAGAVTSAQYLRGNGTNVVMSAIQAADVPTLNQNTTGTASNVTGTVAVANGGTGLTTAPTNGQIDIGSTGVGFVRTTLTAGTGISVTNAAGSVTITNTSPSSGGTVTSVTGTAPVSVATGTTTPVISLASGYGDTQNPYASKTANFILAAPNGVAGVPTFRAIVAADVPTLNQNTTGTASNVTGTVAIANGGTGQTTKVTAFDALSPLTTKGDVIVSDGVDNVRLGVGADNTVLTADSTQPSGVKWAAVAGTVSVVNDTTTATNLYPVFSAATSGSITTVYTGNAKYLYKPSTGELTAPAPTASNGIFVNSQTVATSYTIAAGNSGLSAGPISVNSGITVTLASGARWVVM